MDGSGSGLPHIMGATGQPARSAAAGRAAAVKPEPKQEPDARAPGGGATQEAKPEASKRRRRTAVKRKGPPLGSLPRCSRRMQKRAYAELSQAVAPTALHIRYPFGAAEGNRLPRRIASLDMTAAVASVLAVNSAAPLGEQGAVGRRGKLLSEESRQAARASGEHLISIRSVGQVLLEALPESVWSL